MVDDEGHEGQGHVQNVQGRLRDQCEEPVRLPSLFQIVFGFYLIYAHKVFDEMAAREI